MMNRILPLLLIAPLSTACAAGAPMTAAGNAVVADAYDGAFATIPAPRRLWATPLAIAQHFMGDFPESVEGAPAFDIAMKQDESGQMMLYMTATGYLDDSVAGEQWRIAINPAGTGWGVSRVETRRMCARGENPANWTTSPCP